MICLNSKKRSLKTAVLQTMILALLTAVFLIAINSVMDSREAFAAETLPTLTVRVDGENVRVYETADELESIPDAIETDLTYSGFNSYPTLETAIHIDKAVRVDSIIADSTGMDPGSFDPDSVISLTGYDGYTASFTMEQLFGTERYCFPNAADGTDNTGGRAEQSAYEGKVPVPAVIIMDKDLGANSKETFTFGQAAPNEQNTPECVKYMLTDGFIDIQTAPVDKCEPVSTVEPADGTIIDAGTEIHFLPLPASEKESRNKAYYIVDPEPGEVPGYGDSFYFYSPFKWTKKLINPPVLSGSGLHTVAIKVFAYGKQDSDVKLYRYFVGTRTDSGITAAAVSCNSIRLTWKNVEGASGYRIYRKAGNGAEVLHKTIGSGAATFTDTGLATGTSYSYRISMTAADKDGTVTEFGLTGSAAAKPSLDKPSVRLKAGKRKVTVKWGKVKGASGYVIYRSTKKDKGFKKIKTIKKGSTKSYTNKKLKKGKKYYYRIRAYRTVNGRKVYSSYSAVKKCKVK